MSKRNIGKEIIEGLEELKAWRQGKASAKLKMTRGSGNVFLDVGFSPGEVNNLLLRAQLMPPVTEHSAKRPSASASHSQGLTTCCVDA